MRTFDWLVVIVMGVVGWLVVSFLLNRAKPSPGNDEGESGAHRAGEGAEADAEFPTMPRIPGPDSAIPGRGDTSPRTSAGSPVPASGNTARASVASGPTAYSQVFDASDGSDLLSLDEIGRAWHTILGVSMDASGAQIESAYHSKLAAADRVRFDSHASPANRRLAEQQRARVNQAYEFIRPSRSQGIFD